MKKTILITISILAILLLTFVSAQPQIGAPDTLQQDTESITKATNIMQQYLEYYGYYQAIFSGNVGGIIFQKFLGIAMKDADPQTKATLAFLQTFKQVLPKKVQGRSPSPENQKIALNKQKEISEAVS